MNKVVLRNETPSGEALQATFLPEKGMNMVSFKNGDIEVIDQSTWNLFEERYAGLGALIGPHFHHRREEIIPKIKDESLFPHIQRVKSKGIKEPFSHGIARYAPWQAQATETKISGVLTGKDIWNGVPLAELEGQNFKMLFSAELHPTGLSIDFSIVSDADSLVGLHYYYYLPNKAGIVKSRVKDTMIEQNALIPIPKTLLDGQNYLRYDCTEAMDGTFYPFPNPLEGNIQLLTETHQLIVSYSCSSQENSWQLYHPEGASFVCIEPISAQDPRHPNLSVSSLKVNLQILTGKENYATRS